MFRSEKPFTSGSSFAQFTGQPGDDGGAPAFLLLPGGDHPADVPVELDQFGVYRKIARVWDC